MKDTSSKVSNKEKAPKNLLSIPLGTSGWSGDDQRVPLFALYKSYLDKGIEVQRWYIQRKGSKKLQAIALRWVAICFTLFGVIYPSVLTANIDFFASKQTLGYFSLAAAAACVLADRLLCISSSWRRYVTTAMEVERLTNSFQFRWERLRAETRDTFTTAEITGKALQLIGDFQGQCNDIVVEETKQFFQEFDSSRAFIEASAADTRQKLANAKDNDHAR